MLGLFPTQEGIKEGKGKERKRKPKKKNPPKKKKKRGKSTHPNNAKFGQGGKLVLDGLDIRRHFAGHFRWCEFSKESAKLLLLLRSIRGIPRNVSQQSLFRLLEASDKAPPLLADGWATLTNSPFNTGRTALKPVGNEDLVLVLHVAVSQDVDALERLFKVAKNVVDDHNSLGGIGRTGDVLRGREIVTRYHVSTKIMDTDPSIEAGWAVQKLRHRC